MAGNELYRNQSHHHLTNPRLAESLDDVMSAVNRLAQQMGTSAQGDPGPPPAPSALTVVTNLGVFDVKITDNNELKFGINYFLEWSTTPNFTSPYVIDLGASRNWRGHLGLNSKGGSPVIYFRCYSQYWGSRQASPKTYFGTEASPTVSGLGPVNFSALSSSGSGTAKGDGSQGGSGLGPVLIRNAEVNNTPGSGN